METGLGCPDWQPAQAKLIREVINAVKQREAVGMASLTVV
jgi:hypothetical protein